MNRIGAALSIGILLVLGATTMRGAEKAAPSSPEAALQAFYAFHLTHDMAFTREGVAAREKWLAPPLLEACRAYFAQPEVPGEVPGIDGDPFTDSQEYPTSFAVGAAKVSGASARVPVTFARPGSNQHAVTVVLTKIEKIWLVADIEYESGPPLRAELATPD